MKLYIVRVNENGETYEYEYGCLEHVREHIKMETGECRVYEYINDEEEKEIHIEKEEQTMNTIPNLTINIDKEESTMTTDINSAWLMMYMRANQETRRASKAHWIKVLQESISTGNDDLRSLAERRLAMMAMIEYGEEE